MLPRSPEELATILGVPEEHLSALSKAAHRLYKCRFELKKSGGRRLIEAPFPTLKEVQRQLCSKVLNEIPVHKGLHGRPGTSQITAAAAHVGQRVVISMDIRDFFPSIKVTKLKAELVAVGFSALVAELICQLSTRKRRLPQGAPTSPVLARIVISPLLFRIEGILKPISSTCRFAQFVDDLSLSGPSGLQRVIPTVSRIFAENGFPIHPLKTVVMKENEPKEVLGIRVNDGLQPGQQFQKKLIEARRTLSKRNPKRAGLEAWNSTIAKQNARLRNRIPG